MSNPAAAVLLRRRTGSRAAEDLPPDIIQRALLSLPTEVTEGAAVALSVADQLPHTPSGVSPRLRTVPSRHTIHTTRVAPTLHPRAVHLRLLSDEVSRTAHIVAPKTPRIAPCHIIASPSHHTITEGGPAPFRGTHLLVHPERPAGVLFHLRVSLSQTDLGPLSFRF